MSQPTGGSWNDGQGGSLGQNWGSGSSSDQGGEAQSGSAGQNWDASQGGSHQQGQGSLGQGWDSQGSADASTQQWGGESSSASGAGYGEQSYGQQPSYGQQGGQQGGQPDYAQQNYGGSTQHTGGGFPSSKAAGDGIGALFSDLKFTKSLTHNLAQLTFLAVLVWAVLNFLANTIHNFGSTDFGGADVKNMGTFDAVMHLFADLVWLVLVVAVARILLELAVNVAKLARNRD